MSDAAELRAKAAIREVLENYCRSMDRIDVPLSRATWHPGGRAYYENIFDGTGEEFCGWVAGFHRGFLSTSSSHAPSRHEREPLIAVTQTRFCDPRRGIGRSRYRTDRR
jgi:hypothetical protein